MEPITLITTALVFGATEMGKGSLGEAGKDAYTSLKALILKHFAGNEKAQRALADHEDDPEAYEKPLQKAMQQTQVQQDTEVVRQAQALLAAADPTGTAQGKYIIDNVFGGINQFGDHNQQTINSGPPPASH